MRAKQRNGLDNKPGKSVPLVTEQSLGGNPVDGVKRPMADGNEGSTPALGDAQTRRLLEAPPPDTLKGVRDRAILAILLYHGVRREELCSLRLRDMQSREGVGAIQAQWATLETTSEVNRK